jgi:hypothetical protein
VVGDCADKDPNYETLIVQPLNVFSDMVPSVCDRQYVIQHRILRLSHFRYHLLFRFLSAIFMLLDKVERALDIACSHVVPSLLFN